MQVRVLPRVPTPTPVAQRKESQSTKLRMGVRFSPGVRTKSTRYRCPTGRGGRLNAVVCGFHPCPAHHTGNRRISSTGESTCLVNRLRGFESCIRLHSAPIDDGGRATCFASVAQRTERRVSTSRGAGSNPAGGSRDATTAVPERQPRGFARESPIAFPADGDGGPYSSTRRRHARRRE